MFRTLLVDDDFLVRSYLKTLNAWEKAGYEVVKDVQDGEEALHVLEEEKIDVIITDISMPLMDGIELIRHIREEKENIYIMVLSCHDDFEYVKEAMRLGADEYILKNTLDEDTLLEILEKSRHQIESRLEKSSEQERAWKLIRMGSHTLKYHFFNGILSGTLNGQEREAKRAEAGIRGRFQNSAVINMFMHEWNEKNQVWSPLEAEQYSQSFRHGLMTEMEDLLQEDSDYAEIIYLGAGIFCCFLDMSSMRRSSVMRQRLTNVASACFRYCKKEPYHFGIGVSNICFGEEGIRQAYQQAREMMKLSFYDDSDILYFDNGKEISSRLPEAAEELYERIEILKKGRKQEELAEMWRRVTDACKRTHVDSKLVFQWLRRLDKRAGLERPAEFYSNVHNMDELCRIAENYSRELFADKKIAVPAGVSGAVRHAIEFINGNYKKPISLQDAAEAAGVNPAYLSYLFKQEMEIGFSNYLQECRMECAKELLCTTNYKIKDVASEAGFNDYHYFSKTFKKLNDCSPADYRREHSQ
mgnify:FL=1